MEIPSLIEPGLERVAHVPGVELPGAVDDLARSDRHDVGRTARKPHAAAGKRYLHDMLREIANWMEHVLVRRGDAARGRVVVRAEMGGDDPPSALRDEARQRDGPVDRDDRLRGLDHQLETQ